MIIRKRYTLCRALSWLACQIVNVLLARCDYPSGGVSYDYKKKLCAWIGIHWDDKSRVLAFDPRTGRYAGIEEQRKFSVVLVDPQHGTGEAVSPEGRIVNYDNSTQEVRF